MDVFADAFDLWHEVADASYDEVNFYTCLGGLIEMIDGLFIDEAIGLSDDIRLFAGEGISSFCLDVLLDFGMQCKGSDVQFLKYGRE